MACEKAARGSSNYARARVSTHADTRIVADWERGTLVAGLLVAASFGLMFMVGAWFGW